MSKIEDPNLASAILNKVNDLNVETGAKATAIAAAFAALPQSTSSPLAGVAAIFAALYALNGKLPTSKP